jgi:uncharacterized integral membrane protein
MQQVGLFAVAAILWGGVMVYLVYLVFRMLALEKQIKRVETQDEGNA